MQAEDFLKEFDAGKIGPVYLFVGSSAFLMEEAWKKLLSKALPKGSGNFNGERVQAKEMEASNVIERLATTPMFGGRRFVMVENVDAWGKEDRSAMETFVQRIPPSACLDHDSFRQEKYRGDRKGGRSQRQGRTVSISR